MIRPLITLLFLINLVVAPALADTRDVYTIPDINVDESAASVIEAQQKAFAAARLIGVRRLFSKITLPQDRARAGGLTVDNQLAQRLAAAVDVLEETRGGGRYKGVLSVVVNPQLARLHLQSLGIPFIDQQAAPALVAPVAVRGWQGAWLAAWGDRETLALAPYKVSAITYSATADWLDLEGEANQIGAQRGVVAELLSGNRVSLTMVTAGGDTFIGTTGSAADMESAVQRASTLLDDHWKQEAIIRTDIRTVQQVEILYTSLAEWNKLRGALVRSPLVSDFKINAVARNGAVVTFAYAGDEARLAGDLRQRGVAINADDMGWIMTSAVTGGR